MFRRSGHRFADKNMRHSIMSRCYPRGEEHETAKVIPPQLPGDGARRRRGRRRQPHHHKGPVRAGLGPDRDRAPLRPDRRHLVVGVLARQVRQSGDRGDQQGRRHRRPQGRAGDRGHRVQSGAGRAQAAQLDPARQCRVHRRLGAFRRDAGGAADREQLKTPY